MDHSGLYLIHTHDPGLVALSIIIAMLASYTALDLAGRVTTAHGRTRLSWLVGGAVVMGIGIWSMHFTAMLAFKLSIPVAYDMPIVLASLLVAIVASGVALFVASRQAMRRPQLLGGGLVMGLAIAAMHYIGMAAMRLQANLHYDPVLFTLSIIIAMGASFAALWLAFRFSRQTGARWNWWKGGSAVVMGIAISGMHYTGMAAAIFTLNETLVVERSRALDISWLGAASIVTVTFIVMGFALLLSLVDRRLAAQVAYLAEKEAYHDLVLRTLNAEFEARVAARTHRLETLAGLSERLIAILDVDRLLAEVVNQIKESFGYYHVHIYLLDDKGEKLIMAEGTGEAGAEMKARGHDISLYASTSLVARAARTGDVVTVANGREVQDWQPNPHLLNTYSEIAVPFKLERRVVGVIDVQSDKMTGLDEDDASLLRYLAGQIAVAIRNARLFAQVENSLAKARAVQDRYIEQVWNRSKLTQKGAEYLYTRPDAPTLSEAASAHAKAQALAQNGPAIVAVDSNEANSKALVSPVTLGGKTIGTLQLHKIYADDDDQNWHEQDLALVKAVLDQISQSADNLRLFEETRERAAREQTVREITDKLRAAPNLDLLLETAARELGQRLGVRHTVLELGIETEKNGRLK